MKFRHEIKYLINRKEYIKLRQKIKYAMAMDQNSIEQNGYKVRSLYFDDIDNTALKEKEAGIYTRCKYRIRIYNDEDKVINFEKKNKRGRFINKQSVRITREEYENILKREIDFMKDSEVPLLRDVYIQMKSKGLKPVVIVDYEREPYVYKYGNVRITFDIDLRVPLNSLDVFETSLVSKKIFEEDVLILEIKYDEYLPTYIKNLLQIDSGHAIALSKYVYCREYIQRIKC